jgi:hypothetical protein
MSFEHQGLGFNLLNTPRHQDLTLVGSYRKHLPLLDRR